MKRAARLGYIPIIFMMALAFVFLGWFILGEDRGLLLFGIHSIVALLFFERLGFSRLLQRRDRQIADRNNHRK